MTAPARETAGSVRSAHVAYFLPPDWGRIARHIQPAIERVARDAAQVQVLVIVPDAGASLALARALAALETAAGLRVVAATSAARAQRLLAAGPAHIVIGAPATLAPVVAAAALKLDQVGTVVFAAADELDAESPDLSAVMADVPRTATRLLTALFASEGVEALLERYMHRARRVSDDVAPAEDAAPAPTVRYLTVGGAVLDALPLVLDELDTPSATVLASDTASAAAARAALRGIGYHDESLVRVSTKDVAANTAVVVTLGVPTASAWAAAVAAEPAQIVALIASRELTALQLLAGKTPTQPFAARAAVLKARAADARMRAELRAELADAIPTREVLALEPLLSEHDGLEIAAAALRLLERTRGAQAELVSTTEQRVRTQMKEAQREKEERAAAAAEGITRDAGPLAGASAGSREERPRGLTKTGKPGFGDRPRGDKPRFGDRGDRGDRPRSDKPRSFSDRSDRGDRGDRGERGDKPRAYGTGHARSDKPRPFSDRGDKPRSYSDRGDRPGGDKPRGFAPRGDKPRGAPPRGPRRDDAGGRPPRGPR